jgi:nicotinamidase-related amidase
MDFVDLDELFPNRKSDSFMPKAAKPTVSVANIEQVVGIFQTAFKTFRETPEAIINNSIIHYLDHDKGSETLSVLKGLASDSKTRTQVEGLFMSVAGAYIRYLEYLKLHTGFDHVTCTSQGTVLVEAIYPRPKTLKNYGQFCSAFVKAFHKGLPDFQTTMLDDVLNTYFTSKIDLSIAIDIVMAWYCSIFYIQGIVNPDVVDAWVENQQ